MNKQAINFFKQLHPRIEMLSSDAYASLWTNNGTVCSSIQRTLYSWLIDTKVIKDPVTYMTWVVKK